MTIDKKFDGIVRSITDVVPLEDHEIELLISVIEFRNVKKKDFVLRAGLSASVLQS